MLERLQHDEVLAATLLPPATRTAAAVALDVLSRHGDDLDSDDTLVRRYPVLLSLTPPALGMPPRLPPGAVAVDRPVEPDQSLGPRESLRLRARWVQELAARAAWMLGNRLVNRGLVDDASSVAFLDLESLRDLIADGRHRADEHGRQFEAVTAAFSPPLPPQFRLTPSGDVVPAARSGARPGTGVGAGGGRGTGPATHGSIRNPPAPGDVLVVFATYSRVWRPGCPALRDSWPKPVAPCRTWRFSPGSSEFRPSWVCMMPFSGSRPVCHCSSTGPQAKWFD
jgi:pyruvate,water dikinase